MKKSWPGTRKQEWEQEASNCTESHGVKGKRIKNKEKCNSLRFREDFGSLLKGDNEVIEWLLRPVLEGIA
jgi:hypothetical protein